MNDRIRFLRSLEPKQAGQMSYLAILEAAAGLFEQFPADAITLRDILTQAGVSNQTLYNYFPEGRDDVALALFDRFQRADLQAFHALTAALDWSALAGPPEITRALSACLARATLGNMEGSFKLQSTVHAYLRTHHRGFRAAQPDELEEALGKEIALRYGGRFPARSLPVAARLGVRIAREIADLAMAHPELPLAELESSARKLLRTLLRSGLEGAGAVSQSHELPPVRVEPVSIPSAPVSPGRRRAILDRIFRQKRTE